MPEIDHGEGAGRSTRGPLRILSIDGGGMRGLIPVRVLEELERLSGRQVHELFDLIAGTSTGAILALGLTRSDPSLQRPMMAAELADIYTERGAEIFPAARIPRTARRVFGHQYDPEQLSRVACFFLGEAWLSECVRDVVIPTYDLGRRGPRLLRSSGARADQDADFRMADVVRAACAAPSYFPVAPVSSRMGSERRLVDGGVFVNNPTMLAAAEVGRERPLLIVSLGTGDAKVPFRDRVLGVDRRWYGLRQLFAMAMDGSSEAVHIQARALFADSYHRFDVVLPKSSERLDDASRRNLQSLEDVARDLVSVSQPRLVAILSALTDDDGAKGSP